MHDGTTAFVGAYLLGRVCCRVQRNALGEELLSNYKCVAYVPVVPVRGDATASLGSTAAAMAHINPIVRNFILVLVGVEDFQYQAEETLSLRVSCTSNALRLLRE